MSAYGQLSTAKTWTESLKDLSEELRKWSIEDYVLPTKKKCQEQGYVEMSFVLHGNWVKPRCARWKDGDWKWLERNLRAIFMAIQAARLADQRGIGEVFAQVAKHLALPDASAKRDPYEVLGVPRNVTRDVLRTAYRDAAKLAHPDQGGSDSEFRQVHDAYYEIKRGPE